MPDPFPNPQKPDPDLDGLFRQLRGHVRRRKKRHAHSGFDLVDYDNLLGALKQLRKDCARVPMTDEVKQVLAVFISTLDDENPR